MTNCGREIAERILRMSQESGRSCVTYGDLFVELNGGERWTGEFPKWLIMDKLGLVGEYCCSTEELPMIGSLVVEAKTKSPSDPAIKCMHDFASEKFRNNLNRHPDSDQLKWVLDQARQAINLDPDHLPACSGCRAC